MLRPAQRRRSRFELGGDLEPRHWSALAAPEHDRALDRRDDQHRESPPPRVE
jgi:hypothetical protein